MKTLIERANRFLAEQEDNTDRLWSIASDVFGVPTDVLLKDFEDCKIEFGDTQYGKGYLSILCAADKINTGRDYLKSHSNNIQKFKDTHSDSNVFFDKSGAWSGRIYIKYDGLEKDIYKG